MSLKALKLARHEKSSAFASSARSALQKMCPETNRPKRSALCDVTKEAFTLSLLSNIIYNGCFLHRNVLVTTKHPF